jgi:hypothetical protein
MTRMPLYAFVEGDTMGIVVLANPAGTGLELGEKLIAAVGARVAPRGPFKVMWRDQELDLTATLQAQNVGPLDRVTLAWE